MAKFRHGRGVSNHRSEVVRPGAVSDAVLDGSGFDARLWEMASARCELADVISTRWLGEFVALYMSCRKAMCLRSRSCARHGWVAPAGRARAGSHCAPSW